MHHITFYLAVFLSLAYAVIMIGQAHESHALDSAMYAQRTFQIKLLRAEEMNRFTHQLVQRVAADSTSDPALVALLKDNGVMVTRQGDGVKPSPAPAEDQKGTFDSLNDQSHLTP